MLCLSFGLLLLPLAAHGLQYQGSFTNEDTGDDFELYTVENEVLPRDVALAYHYDSINETDHVSILESRQATHSVTEDDKTLNTALNTHCELWPGVDGIHGGGGCHPAHKFNNFLTEMGLNQTKTALRQLIWESFHLSGTEIKHHARCVLSTNWKKSQLCVSWTAQLRHYLDDAHIAKIVDFALFCATDLQSSAQVATDDTSGWLKWFCVSDRPKGCKPSICKWNSLTSGKTADQIKPDEPVPVDPSQVMEPGQLNNQGKILDKTLPVKPDQGADVGPDKFMTSPLNPCIPENPEFWDGCWWDGFILHPMGQVNAFKINMTDQHLE